MVAFVVLALIGAVFILTVLKLRPEADPLVVFGVVTAWITVIAPGILAYLKSDETHLTVNSQLEVFKATLQALGEARSELAREQGRADGTIREQARMEDKRKVLASEKQVTVVEVKPVPPAPESKSFLS